VRIACSPDGDLHLLVREPDFCQYVLVVYSPALCSVPEFSPVPHSGGQRGRNPAPAAAE
jgi:hypothetical protein